MFNFGKEKEEFAKPHIVICDVCGRGTMPTAEMIYIAEEPRGVMEALTQPPKLYNAMDCPCCGCQIVLNRRFPRVEVKPKAEQDDTDESEVAEVED